jgi:chromosome segregation ATPase
MGMQNRSRGFTCGQMYEAKDEGGTTVLLPCQHESRRKALDCTRRLDAVKLLEELKAVTKQSDTSLNALGAEKAALQAKLDNDVGVLTQTNAILVADMQGKDAEIAKLQAEIVALKAELEAIKTPAAVPA